MKLGGVRVSACIADLQKEHASEQDTGPSTAVKSEPFDPRGKEAERPD
jgi:hypothetical protein